MMAAALPTTVEMRWKASGREAGEGVDVVDVDDVERVEEEEEEEEGRVVSMLFNVDMIEGEVEDDGKNTAAARIKILHAKKLISTFLSFPHLSTPLNPHSTKTKQLTSH